tara:strand:+ start:2675 stop:2938 length:264 start_codon:yes stop_codon:yes gene_type:complete
VKKKKKTSKKKFIDMYKSESFKKLNGSQKTKEISNYWKNKKSKIKHKGKSNPNKGLAFKAANLYLKGDEHTAFKIWNSIMKDDPENV